MALDCLPLFLGASRPKKKTKGQPMANEVATEMGKEGRGAAVAAAAEFSKAPEMK